MISKEPTFSSVVCHHHVDQSLIEKAYEFASQAHKGQKRASGEDYITHPIAVAQTLADLRLDTASIVAALLHDTVEDTYVTLEDIKENFGSDIAFLVHSVTKLSRLQYQRGVDPSVGSFHRLLVGIARDMRAVFIKLADRLHNMRTLEFITSEEKRRRTAQETLTIYAPLAERMGIETFKNDMEDLCMQTLFPEMHTILSQKMSVLQQQHKENLAKLVSDIRQHLSCHQLPFLTVTSRTKTLYSIMRKMERKQLPFEQIPDVFGIRILVNEKNECYQALYVIHEAYTVIPHRFKDYISTPKSNGYQSLHTGIISPYQQRVEVQIRTKTMDEVATYGMAAHWCHKHPEDNVACEWAASLVDMLQDSEHTSKELTATMVFEGGKQDIMCLTPKHKRLFFPKGATCVDFAYAIHSQVGDHSLEAEVNGQRVPLRTPLKSGDVINILTAASETISVENQHFATTAYARSHIRRLQKAKIREESEILGRRLFERAAQKFSLDLRATEPLLMRYLEDKKYKNTTELWADIGLGRISVTQVIHDLSPDPSPAYTHDALWHHHDRESFIPLEGLTPGVAIHYAGCCYPVLGDEVLGIMTAHRGITVHRQTCHTLLRYKNKPERLLRLSWKHHIHTQSFIGRIVVQIIHQPGALGMMASLIGKQSINIVHIKMEERTPEYFRIVFDLEIQDKSQIENLMGLIRMHQDVQLVQRL